MRNIIPYEKDIVFDTKLAEITSISLEHDEEISDSEVNGEFIISGDYKVHQISVNKEEFMYKIPYTIELNDVIDKDSINVDINDFTYDIKDNNTLSLKIELLFEYQEKEEIKDAEIINEVQEQEKEEELDREIEEMITNQEKEEVVEKSIINSMSSENTYVSYHVYVVNEEDSLESICQKFNVSKETLYEYNDFETLSIGDKLLIPLEDE